MSNDGFIKKPNSLLSNQLWQEASGAERRILERLMELTVWEPTRMVKGILLKRRQVMFTIRQIALEEQFSKHVVESAIYHFSGLTRSGKERSDAQSPIMGQKAGQQSRQEKSIHTMMIEGFLDDEQTTNGTTNGTRTGQERDKLPSGVYVLRHEDEKTSSNKLDESIVRAGGNVDNSQASYQHSPQPVSSFSQKGEQKQGSPASPVSLAPAETVLFDPTDTLKLFRVLEDFRYSIGTWEGISLTEKDKRAWISLTKDEPQDLLEALAFYKKQEKQAKDKSRTFKNPPGFITTIICDRLWEKKKAQDKAKKADQEHLKRLKANGRI